VNRVLVDAFINGDGSQQQHKTSPGQRPSIIASRLSAKACGPSEFRVYAALAWDRGALAARLDEATTGTDAEGALRCGLLAWEARRLHGAAGLEPDLEPWLSELVDAHSPQGAGIVVRLISYLVAAQRTELAQRIAKRLVAWGDHVVEVELTSCGQPFLRSFLEQQ
jgi:hypothetical protein